MSELPSQQEVKTPSVLQDSLIVSYNNESFVFKIPSIKDRMRISSYAAKLRRETDPDGLGLAMGYDAGSSVMFEAVAGLICLIKEAPPRWMKPSSNGTPAIDLDSLGEDMPVMEVMNQFYLELDRFRQERAGSK
jgi:hypothetical protein